MKYGPNPKGKDARCPVFNDVPTVFKNSKDKIALGQVASIGLNYNRDYPHASLVGTIPNLMQIPKVIVWFSKGIRCLLSRCIG